MDFFGAIFSSLLSIIFFCMIIAGVLKLFQIVTLLGEIKDVLLSQRHQNIVPPAAVAQERPAPPSAQWTPAPAASSRPASTVDFPNYSQAASPSTTALETVPRVIREHTANPAHVPQSYLAPSLLVPSNDYQTVGSQEAPPVALDGKMSGEEMLRALDVQLRADGAKRASGIDGAQRATVVDTTLVTPHE